MPNILGIGQEREPIDHENSFLTDPLPEMRCQCTLGDSEIKENQRDFIHRLQQQRFLYGGYVSLQLGGSWRPQVKINRDTRHDTS